MRIAVWLKEASSAEPIPVELFQSAVRIAVWLKNAGSPQRFRLLLVSIRRADRCLVEGTKPCRQLRVVREVSIRRADRCLVEVVGGFVAYQVLIIVSIRRADRCLVEDGRSDRLPGSRAGFNPPCGSLFG